MDHTHAIHIPIVVAIPIAIGTVSSVISVAVVHRDRPGRWLLRCSPLGRESQLMGVVVLLPAAGGGRDVDVNVAYGPRCGFVAAWQQSLFPHLPAPILLQLRHGALEYWAVLEDCRATSKSKLWTVARESRVHWDGVHSAQPIQSALSRGDVLNDRHWVLRRRSTASTSLDYCVQRRRGGRCNTNARRWSRNSH